MTDKIHDGWEIIFVRAMKSSITVMFGTPDSSGSGTNGV
jgi:hypothetical protein